MIKHKQRTATTFSTDASGRRIAHVALSGTADRAKLLADDLERILADGYSPCWSFTDTGGGHSYVLVVATSPKGGPRTVTIARLVTRAGRRQIVKYADRDRLNLLPENLLVMEGRAWTPIDRVTPRTASREGGDGEAQAMPQAPMRRHTENPGHRNKPRRPAHRVRCQSTGTVENKATRAEVLRQISETVSK